jgi:hypothetical protein
MTPGSTAAAIAENKDESDQVRYTQLQYGEMMNTARKYSVRTAHRPRRPPHSHIVRVKAGKCAPGSAATIDACPAVPRRHPRSVLSRAPYSRGGMHRLSPRRCSPSASSPRSFPTTTLRKAASAGTARDEKH